MNIFTYVAKLGHLKKKKRVCVASPVFMAVCGDDMVGCVAQLLAHETPGDSVQLWISLHFNNERQTLA